MAKKREPKPIKFGSGRTVTKLSREINEPDFVVPYWRGKQIAEVLRRYINEELVGQRNALLGDKEAMAGVQKDIDYIADLAQTFRC